MKLTESITCPQDDAEAIYHIPSNETDATLCGLSDVPYETHDVTETGITCDACKRRLKWCKNLKIPNENGDSCGK